MSKAVLKKYRIVPRTGTRFVYGQQSFTLVGSTLHTRKDGERVPLLIWISRCADCDQVFEITTPMTIHSLNRRCDEHKSPGRKVHMKPSKTRRLPAKKMKKRSR